MHVQYVTHKYGKCVVVFDGYSDEPSVKDMTHLRRGTHSVAVHCTANAILGVTKDVLLANKKYKQRLIHMLSERLEQAGCQCIHARGDADCLIVQTAVVAAVRRDVIVVAEDTNILVLLCYHADATTHNVCMIPELKPWSAQKVWDIQHLQYTIGACRSALTCHFYMPCLGVTRRQGRLMSAKHLSSRNSPSSSSVQKSSSSLMHHRTPSKHQVRMPLLLFIWWKGRREPEHTMLPTVC